jgi:drug/metabolite transporter (DMT)-like permease
MVFEMIKSYLSIFFAAFFFATMEVVSKIVGFKMNAMQLIFLRYFIGGVFLLPFALHDFRKRQNVFTKSDWLYLLLLGIVLICVSMTLAQLGIMRINANLAAVIACMTPVFTMLSAHVIGIEGFTRRKALALLLDIVGLVIFADPAKILSGNSSVVGILISLGGAMAFGLYSALGKKRVEKIGGMCQNSFSFLLGSGILLVILLATGTPVIKGVGADNIWPILYLGIFVTGVAYVCYSKAIELSGPSIASVTFFIKPVLAPIIACIILSEAITVNVIVGVLFVLAGSVVNLTGGKKTLQDSPQVTS